MKDGKDIGVTKFFEEDSRYVVGLIMIHPDCQENGLGGKIIREYINL